MNQLISIKKVIEFTGVSRSTIYEVMDENSPYYDPTFPRKVTISQKRIGWSAWEINQWIEAKLVETAWDMNLPKHLVQIQYDDRGILVADNKIRRVNVTSAKSALNGYQKSRCFYCFAPITIEHLQEHSADVDHFFPHRLRECDIQKPINGVANLVLACPECNRGQQGKSDRLPSVNLLERLHKRNEYLITSHHPLR